MEMNLAYYFNFEIEERIKTINENESCILISVLKTKNELKLWVIDQREGR